ncbi:MAG TPA: hypothetical protein VGO43_11745 [Pyrinomonadaceae bacterium]|jgi:hypothetical protein|nr:hypothetical protein [Pyrinomonadaceae bacterium]
MFKGIIVAGCLVAMGVCSACVVSAQDTGGRVRELVSQLDKTKHKTKDKGSYHYEVYAEVRNEPVVMKPTDLAGKYISPDTADFRLDLTVASNGTATATGTGYEMVGVNAVRVNYTFTGRIDGALLTGTRTLEDGRKEPFEACFVNRTVRSGKNEADAAVTHHGFGIGYLQKDEHWSNRVYLEKM